ncbi:MAG: aa3-type cytochrome c oxidase subunit IV [Boseongicola sp.]
MTDHKHGEMNIDSHEKTFVGFVNATKYVVIAVILVLIFLAIFNS